MTPLDKLISTLTATIESKLGYNVPRLSNIIEPIVYMAYQQGVSDMSKEISKVTNRLIDMTNESD